MNLSEENRNRRVHIRYVLIESLYVFLYDRFGCVIKEYYYVEA